MSNLLPPDGAISRLFARQACSATAGPTISLSASSSAVQVQNTGSVSATTTLSTSAVCNGAISCSVAKVDQGADFTVSLTGGVLTATFPSTITPKSYEALISCDEAVANVTTPLKNTATWTIYPYKSNGLTLVNGGNTITCTDSAPCLITSDVLNVTSPSNVPASLICYSTTKVQGSFKAVPVPPITELNCLFTQDDIDKGNVFYIAQKILYPGSPVSEEILFSVWDSLDSSNVLTTARLPVTVSWKYQPLLTDKAINLTATVNAPSTLAYTLFSYSEVHGLSG